MSDELQNNVLESRVSLPKPDVDNITVLTKSLPNEPVLPWHHFDSPWLEQEKDKAQIDEAHAPAETDSSESPEEAAAQQLTLELAESEVSLDIFATDNPEPDDSELGDPEPDESEPVSPENTPEIVGKSLPEVGES